MLALWVVLIGVFLAVWQFISPADGGPPRYVEPAETSALPSGIGQRDGTDVRRRNDDPVPDAVYQLYTR